MHSGKPFEVAVFWGVYRSRFLGKWPINTANGAFSILSSNGLKRWWTITKGVCSNENKKRGQLVTFSEVFAVSWLFFKPIKRPKKIGAFLGAGLKIV
jgi:hypothetical protein